MYSTRQTDILPVGAYIVCAHEDMPIAREIYKGLKENGVNLQLHVVNFVVGHDLESAAFDAIKAAAVLIVYISNNSFKGDRLTDEQRAVLDFVAADGTREKPIVVVTENESLLHGPSPLMTALRGRRGVPTVDISKRDSYKPLAKQLLDLQKSQSIRLGFNFKKEVPRLFISYSHADEGYKDKLVKHLCRFLDPTADLSFGADSKALIHPQLWHPSFPSRPAVDNVAASPAVRQAIRG